MSKRDKVRLACKCGETKVVLKSSLFNQHGEWRPPKCAKCKRKMTPARHAKVSEGEE